MHIARSKDRGTGDKLADKLAEVTVETLVTLLFEMKAEALMDTPAASLTDVEIDTLGETVAQIHAEALSGKLAHGLKGWTVNETVVKVKAQALVDTQTTRQVEIVCKWQNTRKFGGLSSSRHTGRQTSRIEVLTLNETLPRRKHACPHTRSQASRGGE